MRYLGDSILWDNGGMYGETPGIWSATLPEEKAWWEKVLQAGVTVAGGIWGSDPQPAGTTPTGYAAPAAAGVSTGILVAGVAVLALILSTRK